MKTGTIYLDLATINDKILDLIARQVTGQEISAKIINSKKTGKDPVIVVENGKKFILKRVGVASKGTSKYSIMPKKK